MIYKAIEFDKETCQTTGRQEFYNAKDIDEAVGQVLYTRQLGNGSAFIGPTGRVVYCGNLGYAVTTVNN